MEICPGYLFISSDNPLLMGFIVILENYQKDIHSFIGVIRSLPSSEGLYYGEQIMPFISRDRTSQLQIQNLAYNDIGVKKYSHWKGLVNLKPIGIRSFFRLWYPESPRQSIKTNKYHGILGRVSVILLFKFCLRSQVCQAQTYTEWRRGSCKISRAQFVDNIPALPGVTEESVRMICREKSVRMSCRKKGRLKKKHFLVAKLSFDIQPK